VASVEAAATLIGFKEVHRLVGFALLNQIAEEGLPSYAISSGRFRENSLFAALLMEELGAGAQEDPRSCLYDRAAPLDREGRARQARAGVSRGRGALRNEDTSVSEWESCVFGVTSKRGRSDNPGCLAVSARNRFSHQPSPRPEGLHMPLTHMLHIAAGMADLLGHGLPGESNHWHDSDNAFRMAGLEPRIGNRIIDHALASFSG